uniref:DNA polymerase n=1 Tax=Dermatophagoides pteronyssinus TaxID=6956 RepID=A0A6P6XTY3_DERPT|nr:DNA polymerase zeta catalytic subunit-like [Dermatophagoides pteronyssinus]
MNIEHGLNCFRITFFNIDSYITKPDLILDETYSSYRKRNINLATVVRVFGTTDDGISTCVHIHQHFPHLSIRRNDLIECYHPNASEKDDTAIIDLFIKDLENSLSQFVDSRSKDEIQIINVETFDSFSFYGYHEKPETFYRIYFTTYWMANQAKNSLESGVINSYKFVCYDFLEFLLQFYIDRSIYLNTLTFKQITFRKHRYPNVYEDIDRIRDRQFNTVSKILFYNDLNISTTCQFECDALAEDIMIVERNPLFPSNELFNPSMPGIISLWNRQFQRSSEEEFQSLLNVLQSRNSIQYSSHQFQLKRHHIFDINTNIPQLDGHVDSEDDSQSLLCQFNGKQIHLDRTKFHKGIVLASRLNPRSNNFTKSKSIDDILRNIPFTIERSDLIISNVMTKWKMFESIERKINTFNRTLDYLEKLPSRLKNFQPSNSLQYFIQFESTSNPLKLRFRNDCSTPLIVCSPQVQKRRNPFEKKPSIQNIHLDNFIEENNLKMMASSLCTTTINSSLMDDSNQFEMTKINESFRSNHIEWIQCSHLTIMSMELHARIRLNLTPDPNYDPIQMIMFTLHRELLDDSSSVKKPYMVVIIVNPNAKNMEYNLKLKNRLLIIDYVPTEVDLFLHFSRYVQQSDPDIILGYVVDTQSWGYLLQRAIVLGFQIGPMFSRVINTVQSKHNSAGGLNESPELVGRIVLNTWRLLRHELALRSYTFENVYHHLFHVKIPKLSNQLIGQLWQTGFMTGNNELSRHLILEYYLQRTLGSMRIMNHLNYIRRVFDLSCAFGMPFFDVIERGSQFRVESMLLPLCSQANYLPIRFSKHFIRRQRAPQYVPLIYEPDIRIHLEPVAVLDFQSLYPSVIIAHNYCYSTCLGRLQNIISGDDTFGCYKLQNQKQIFDRLSDDQIHISENGIVFVRRNVRQGILPKMLEEILNTRILIKRELKNVDRKLANPELSRSERKRLKALRNELDNSQLAMKLISNVTYGYTSANFTGRMPCIEIADSIVSKGRQTLEEVITFINRWGQTNGSKVKVIYGDTDSVFISFPGHSLATAFEITNFFLTEINRRQPYPICLKLEKIYQPCIIMAKKRYCGYAFDSATDQARFDSKGIETIRRDGCPLTGKIMEQCIRILFDSNGNVESLKPYIQHQFDRILCGRIGQLSDFIFARQFAGFNNYCNGDVIPACIIARKRIQIDPRDEPKFKERVGFVVIDDNDSNEKRRVADLVRQPFDLLADDTLRLNGDYYIKSAIIAPMIRVLDSIFRQSQKCLNNWYEECRIRNKQNRQNIIIGQQLMRQLQQNDQEFNILIDFWQNQQRSNLKNDYSEPLIRIMNSFQNVRFKLKRIEQECCDCLQFDWKLIFHSSKHPCKMDNCRTLYRYHQSKRDFNYLWFLQQALLIKSKMS